MNKFLLILFIFLMPVVAFAHGGGGEGIFAMIIINAFIPFFFCFFFKSNYHKILWFVGGPFLGAFSAYLGQMLYSFFLKPDKYLQQDDIEILLFFNPIMFVVINIIAIYLLNKVGPLSNESNSSEANFEEK